MSHKTTIVLLVALTLGVGYLAAWKNGWMGLGAEKKPEKPARLGKALIDPTPDTKDLVRVELTRPGQPTLVA
ncbi:MAG: hypothetical protein PHU85_01570, partial [Phycisphaerae bacterium]|nr:hypothetical protein [Phycisphaerae bacterium]